MTDTLFFLLVGWNFGAIISQAIVMAQGFPFRRWDIVVTIPLLIVFSIIKFRKQKC